MPADPRTAYDRLCARYPRFAAETEYVPLPPDRLPQGAVQFKGPVSAARMQWVRERFAAELMEMT